MLITSTMGWGETKALVFALLITTVKSQEKEGNWTTLTAAGDLLGPKGEKGEPGIGGLNGFSGAKGEIGIPGLPGSDGLPGPKGYDGRCGAPGPRPDSTVGRPGDIGEKGLPGRTGPAGIKGPKGSQGSTIPGRPGPRGSTGETGRPGRYTNRVGRPGEKGDAHPFSGTLVVRHSQDSSIPKCSYPGHEKLWDGFSLMHVRMDDRFHHFDLGMSSSCLKIFTVSPFSVCDEDNACRDSFQSDKSYWLTTNAPVPELPFTGRVIRSLISRCVVCDVPGNVVSIHSQSTEIPECPTGWEGLWTGFSFVMGTVAQERGQPLSSTGSCLENFMVTPFIECNSTTGMCNSLASEAGFWLTTAEIEDQFSRSERQEFDHGDIRFNVSRCQVCAKITRDNPIGKGASRR